MNPARKPLIAGNWKMYHGGARGIALARGIADGVQGISGVSIVVAPPFTALGAVAAELEHAGSAVEVSAQNLYPKPEGAFTGEISAPMLLESGCKWVIIGHSERRQFFGETDQSVHEKTVDAIRAGLRPIVCLGETLAEREAGKTMEVVGRQTDAILHAVSADEVKKVVIAYEPVWAIGTGRTATSAQAQEAHAAIRERLARKSPSLAEKTLVLYGGSVKADNAATLLACPDVDGALVGGASLEAGSFVKIVKSALPS